MLRRQRPPAPAVSGQPVDGQDLRRLLGAEAMHVEEMRVAGHGVDASRHRDGQGLSDPRDVMPTCPHRTSRRRSTALTEPGIARRGARPRWPGHRQDPRADRHRRRAHRRRRRPGIRSAADGFGAARHAGPRRASRRPCCAAGSRAVGARTAGPHGALVRLRGAAARRAAQRRSAAAADHQRRAGRHHPRAARRRPRGRGQGRRRMAPPAAARAEHRRVRHRAARPVGPLHRARRGSRLRCNASAGCRAARSGWPRASSPSSTSR